jgi:hypothetical protein
VFYLCASATGQAQNFIETSLANFYTDWVDFLAVLRSFGGIQQKHLVTLDKRVLQSNMDKL